MIRPFRSLVRRFGRRSRTLLLALPLALAGGSVARLPWTDLTEADGLFALATRFASVDGHRVHYPTPTAELARLLEARSEAWALRHLAEARAELGDRPGALAAMEAWAASQGPEAWAETARWAYARLEVAAAFRAADRAVPGLRGEARRSLADERIRWADRHPDQADRIALRQARASLFPEDAAALEDWLRALEKAGRLEEADRALAGSKALSPERSLLLRSDLLADHRNHRGALQVLDEAISRPWSIDVRRAFAQRVQTALPSAPSTWRATLEKGYDPAALVRLATCFQGQGRGDAATDLLRQVERRCEGTFDREARLLVARLYLEVDAVPEAFRSTLAAAHLASPGQRPDDLAALARLALRAGARPLALGAYNDEGYRWAARVDRSPGLWTGGLSFLLTGQDWNAALQRLENESLPDRTFQMARWLAEELAKGSPSHPGLPALQVAIMERHVERGEGKAALALLPRLEQGPSADEARRVALLAMRQVQVPVAEEARLMKARLRHQAADGTRPGATHREEEAGEPDEPAEPRPWARRPKAGRAPGYPDLLNECLARLEHRDPSHQASLGLVLGELDRLPDAEDLWLALAARLEGWNLDDELGPRYEQALQRFQGAGIWERSARWYARRNRHTELRRLAESLAQRFRGAEIFARSDGASQLRLEIPEQPPAGGRVRLVPWADWVRFKALERFPQSPRVFHEAQRLITVHRWQETGGPSKPSRDGHGAVVVPDALMTQRRWALLFIDPIERERFFAEAMRSGTLAARLRGIEAQATRNPVEELFLFEGWARLSSFERAVAPAERLAVAYPGDGPLAKRVLSLQRSLNGLDASRSGAAHALVARVAPALEDPAPLWTELGELEEERGHSEAAQAIWARIVDREPRNPARISELATLLWDYGHDAEALSVVEAGRRRLDRPRFFAFETGVLRENLKDADGAVREYLDALRPEGSVDVLSAFEQDQRSLRRLAQLLGRARVYRTVERRIQGLRPGVAEDERTLAAFFPLAGIVAPVPGLGWDADAWIDALDQPNDPVGRAQREARKDKDRPAQYDGIARIGEVLLEKALQMAAKATTSDFLSATRTWSGDLIDRRWAKPRAVAFRNTLMARAADLAPDEGARIRLEIGRARFLAENGREAEADALWASLDPRIGAIPEGAARLRAEAERAAYLERAKGAAAASSEWKRLTGRYGWSLGLLEDRLAFLQRSGQGEEARKVLEEVAPKAAAGHREALLERLTRDCLAASDLPRARRAVDAWLGEAGLDGARRLGAVHLLARLSWRERRDWDPQPLARSEAARLNPEEQAELWRQLARAADLESAPSLALWIEALNRRTEREWISAASRSAERAGKGGELLGYFEAQLQRSPRDVRWAVAVRDIRAAYHQVEGALQAAKAAVAVRPEREILWREAADLLVRADRVKEAADFLEGWNRPRPADEGVARWRSELYARAGDGERALAIERAALEAFRKAAPADREELAERKARATMRLLEIGLPHNALRLHGPTGDIQALAGTRVPAEKQCELALLTGQFPRLLAARSGDAEFLGSAAPVLRHRGRPEHRDEVQAFLVGQLLSQGQPQGAALARWWPFAAAAGLEPGLRTALASDWLSRRPGPWQVGPPLPFVIEAGRELVAAVSQPGGTGWAFREPDLAKLWARDLARRDRGDDLVAFLEPRWQELLSTVKGSRPVDASTARVPWAGWFDDPSLLMTWTGASARSAERGRELGEVLADRRLWDRFWALAARKWQAAPLLALAPPPARAAWYAHWAPPVQGDPVLAARRRRVEDVTQALERLLKGAPGAAEDALIDRLRGPRSVGEVLGQDARWLWPEFVPRRDGKGDIAEKGEDRVAGSGADRGRNPGALWGERPGEAWYVLETLARYRRKDPSASFVPLDVPQRGGETDRLLLSMRLATALGHPDTALELDASRPAAPGDRRRLEAKIRLQAAAGRKDLAQEAWQAYLRHAQGSLGEEEFRWHAALADDLGLPGPLDLLDPARPVGPAFLAYLHDRRPERAGSFRTLDPTGFRLALANRWRGRPTELSTEQVRFWMRELWAGGHAGLPHRALARLGGIWPHAAEWLEHLPPAQRTAALDALQEATRAGAALPGLFTEASAPNGDEVLRLLIVRLRLARNEQPQALALVDGLLLDMRRSEALGLPLAEHEPDRRSEEGEEEGTDAPPPPSSAGDPVADRLQAWLRPFREARWSEPVEERFRTFLRQRRAEGPATVAAWRLALQLSPAGELEGLAAELEKAWFRGDLPADQLGALAEGLAPVLPGAVPRWLARWPRNPGHAQSQQRAAILAASKQAGAALAVLADSRRRSLWRSEEETQAFDQWRRLGGPSEPASRPPATWAAALPFWGPKPPAAGSTLVDRLRAHPHDVLSARSLLRTPAGAEEETLARVGIALGEGRTVGGDHLLLRIKAARGLLAGSPRAAAIALGPAAPEEVRRMLVERRMKSADINAALADLARIASRSGAHGQASTYLAALGERKAPNLQALYAELADHRGASLDTTRLVDGRPAPLRPRDLTWSLLARVLTTEGVR